MKVIWSSDAEITFAEIIDFLSYRWGQKYIERFFELTKDTMETISNSPTDIL